MALPVLLWADDGARKNYDLAAGDAAETLPQFVRQSGEEIVYMVDRVRGVRTNAVRGEFSSHSALEQMLAGTELKAVADARSGAITVQRMTGEVPTQTKPRSAQSNDQLVVLSAFEVVEERSRGYQATNTTSATRLNTPIVDLSKNISVITRDLIDDMKVTEFNEALYLSASVSATSPYSGRVAVRGLENAAPKRNGLGNYGSDESITDTATMERIEVVKGPSSLLYGSSSPGGLVNYITKKPTSYRLNNIRMLVGSNKRLRTEIDSGGPVFNHENFSYRFVGAHENTDGPGRYNLSERGIVAGSVRWQLSPKTYMLVGAEYVSSKRTSIRPNNTTISLSKFGPSGIYDGDFEFNQGWLLTKFQRDEGVGPGISPFTKHDTFVTRYDVDVYHAFTDNLKAFVNYNWMQNKLIEVNSGGGYEGWAARPVDSPSFNEMTLTPELRWPNRIQNNITATLNYNLKRAWMELDIIGGMEYYKFDLEFSYHRLINSANWQKVNFLTLAGYDQVRFANTPATILQDIRDTNGTNWEQQFYYLREQAYHAPYLLLHGQFMDKRLRIIAGIRKDNIQINQLFFPMDRSTNDPFKLAAPAPTDSKSSATTPLLGVSITPLKNQRGFTVYSSFSKSLVANEIVNPDGSSLPPETGEGIEVGIKLDLNQRLSATLSWFKIDKKNLARIIQGTNPAFWEATGLQRSKGVDLDLFYAITPDWQLIASGAVIDAFYVTDNNPIFIGTQIGGVPEWSYSLWTKYGFSSGNLKGFHMGGGLVSKPSVLPFGAGGPLLRNPAYTRIDLIFGYNTKIAGCEWEFSLKVNNLTDKLYLEGQSGWGPARGYQMSAMVRF
jgi:iron complex outermembrane receptor protein